MVRSVRLPAAPPPPVDQTAGPLQRVSGLAGIAIAMVVADGLGIPLPGGELAIDMLLVVIGYRLTFALRQHRHDDRRLARFWLGTVGRLIIPAVTAAAVGAAWASRSGGLDSGEIWATIGAVGQVLNLLLVAGVADFAAIEHLWIISLLVQFALLAPLIVFAGPQLRPARRMTIVAGLAVLVAGLRVALIVGGVADAEAVAALRPTHIDGLLVGATIAVAPLPSLRRRIPVELTPVLFAVLLLLRVAAPATDGGNAALLAVLSVGTVALTAAVLAAAAAGGLAGTVTSVIDRAVLRWLGTLAVPLLVWYALFANIFFPAGAGTEPTLGTWPGLSSFIVTMVFTLTAAVVSHRSLELPLTEAAGRLVSRRTEPSPGATAGSAMVDVAAVTAPVPTGASTDTATSPSVAEPTIPGRIPMTPSVAGPTLDRPLATAPVAELALAGHGVAGSAGVFDVERGRGDVVIADGAAAVDGDRADGSAVAAIGATPDRSAVAAHGPGLGGSAVAVAQLTESSPSGPDSHRPIPSAMPVGWRDPDASARTASHPGMPRTTGIAARSGTLGARAEARPDPKPVGGAITVGGPGVAPRLKPLRLSTENPTESAPAAAQR
ncbi:MAG: hypothetical protein AAF547_21880 [Actinomycetota bacterium]